MTHAKIALTAPHAYSAFLRCARQTPQMELPENHSYAGLSIESVWASRLAPAT